MKARASEKKKQEVAKLTQLIKSEPIIGIIDLTNLPSAQFQKIKHKLRKNLNVRVTKKALIKLALEKAKEDKKGLEKLEKYLENCMPAVLLTKEDAFKVSSLLAKNKSSSAAKPGQIAPKDIMIPEGPTAFAPGPIIGELGQAGIKASIEDGKVVIKEAATIVKKGEEISQKQSDMLSKFGIEPMEIGLNVVAIYQDGDIFEADILAVDEKEYLNMIKTAAAEALNLAVYSAYPTKETIEILLQKAERESLALESKVPEAAVKEEPKTEEPPEEEPQAEPPKEEAPKEEEKPVEEPKVEQPVEETPKVEEPKEEKKPEEVPAKDNTQDSKTEVGTTQNNPAEYTDETAKKAQDLINKLKDQETGG
jgi:large subunit ribosomal protein L10